MKKSHLFVGAAAFAVAISVSQPVLAQEAAASDDTAESEGTSIVVTGSRIARPNLESTVPVVSITGEDLSQTGRVSTGDVLNDLPALQSTFSQANSTRFLGTAGLNLLDLRGLGTQRTLVLVNGRRHVGSDILSNAVSPDVNTFPSDLIERVDVVTGGNSAVYGSDAIAGVVNFILKKDFEGIQVRGQGGISQYGDAGTYYGSILAGQNFADGRGNVAINLEYARQNQTYGSGRKYLRSRDVFIAVDTDPANAINGSDGIPDSVFYRDTRLASISNGGTVLFRRSDGACGRDSTGASYSCAYIFNPQGQLVPQTGSRIGFGPVGTFVGGNGENLREGELLQLIPQLDRYSVNLIGHFEVSPAFVPFIEAKYVRTDSSGSGGSGPAFFQGSTIDAFYERPRLDNPYLAPEARALIAQQILESGLNPNTGAALTAAQIAQVNNGSFRFPLRKNLTDLGVRREDATRETYRIVAGFSGEFNDDWNYEIAANYGEFREDTKVLGNLNVQRALLALDAVRDPTTGAIVCGSKLDPSRAYDDFAGDPNVLAGDIAACQPLNPFGLGSISPEAKNYVLTDTISKGKITQLDISAFLSGDSSQWFELPGGPVGFAIGAEYRRETAYFKEDPLVESGYTFYNAIAEFDPPSFEVKEIYGEVRLPLLKDSPLAHELSVSAAGRISDYKGSTGTVYAYNAGIDWAPIEDIRFRASYARAVRAPNLADLYSPQSQNFAPGFGDPCSAINIGNGSETRPANCAAAGIPTSYDYRYASSLEILSGGNPDLNEETSDSYTVGAVLQPRWVPGLSLSVDYFNIKVNDVITAPSAQQIVNACYDAVDLNNQFCSLFERAGPNGADSGEEAYRIIEGSLQQTLLNYASLKTRGLDFTFNYDHRFNENFKLSTRVIYTHVLENASFLNPADPTRGDTFNGELGSPRDAFNWDIDLDFNKFFLNYQLRYLSKMTVSTYEAVNSYQGRDPENADVADILYYPDVIYMDLRAGFKVNEGSTFYVGVDNLTNRLPPLGSTGIGGGSGIYESIGRRFYAGITAKF